MALPFLPGNSFRNTLGKQKFHLSHHFDYANDVAMNVGEAKPGIGGDPRPDQKYPARFSSIPRGHGTDLPAWVAFDRQVLAYDAYFQEAVHEKREEQYRVRRVKIYFYLEDDSIQVIEPRLKNTGVPQGTLIRRHRVLKPAPLDDLYYTVEDFNIGNEISMYGRVFKIVDCDEFTKNFQRKLGFQERTRLQIPGDPYLEHRKALDEMMQPLRPYERHDTLKQFLDHDRHVLRFFAFWDDTDQMFGDPREMVLHYFLADDTIEIRERIAVNAGRDAVPMFLHRSKLPKGVDPLPKPGEETPRTVLNVFGPMGHGGRYILDSLKTGARDQEFYKDSDLSIGAVLNVWGRKFLLCDCDDFTKEYYMTKYGITDFTAIAYRAPDQPRAPKEVPPYNGFGSEEDSLCSTKGLLPKPPKMDFIKFMEKDRHGLDSNVLRFLAVMDTMKPIDKDRQFIVSFFLSDDTLQVYEPIVRNSGIIGGRFLERGRVKRPDQPRFSTELSQYYRAQDLYVGARLNFNGHKFILVDGDEYAFNYMERHAEEYPIANIQVIMERLQRLTEGKMDEFMKPDTQPTTDYQGLHALLMEMTSGQMSDHEVATVARNYQHRGDETVTFENLVSVAQEQLRKVNYEDFVKIVNQCLHYDRERKGVLSPDDVRAVFVSLRIPVNGDLLRAILSKAPVEEGMLRYREFVAVFNWRDNPAPPPPPQVSSRPDEAWMGTTPNRQIGVVDLQRFLKDVFGQ